MKKRKLKESLNIETAVKNKRSVPVIEKKNYNIFIGIDPGYSGGICVLHKAGHVLTAIDMPITESKIKKPNGKYKKEKDINSKFIFLFIKELINQYNCPCCVIERSQSMPSQGIASTFNYGVGFGKLLSILEVSDINFVKVRPSKWKKHFDLLKKEKIDSVLLAEKMFPGINFRKTQKTLLDGKAEACLMAEYGRQLFG